jgi:UDP-glucose 4-epimerase
VPAGRLIEGELSDQGRLVDVLRSKRVDAVIHFAASALVGESVADPAKYYQNNVVATHQLLGAMLQASVRKIVFSSTTATYGAPQRIPISEDERQAPVNPYGFTKLVIEQMLRDYAQAYGLSYAALRYFNAAGASPDGDLGEDHQPESHLIPIVLQVALGLRDSVTIFGDDYPTPDRTCIRDYVHVDDLASAHLLALGKLADGVRLEMNLGTGQGHSVREVIESCRRISGCDIPVQCGPRRAGDPPMLVADSRMARKALGWTPRFTRLDDIVQTAWRWHQSHPTGYDPSS